jgi:exopolysaccharide biosynthesis WecB/TagA/CpsF family protein
MAADVELVRRSQPPSRTIFDINAHGLSLISFNQDYAAAISAADLVHADGQFIVWIARFLTPTRIPERTCTTDVFERAAAFAAESGCSFFLYGGPESINRRCAEEMVRRHPGLRIAGRVNGYVDADIALAEIEASRPDIVWVGLGKPREQVFAVRAKARLSCAWIVTCGGCFHYMVGDYARAPVWVQNAGLEWAHRTLTGPRGLLLRNAVTVPHAILKVLKSHVLGFLAVPFRPSFWRASIRESVTDERDR